MLHVPSLMYHAEDFKALALITLLLAMVSLFLVLSGAVEDRGMNLCL